MCLIDYSDWLTIIKSKSLKKEDGVELRSMSGNEIYTKINRVSHKVVRALHLTRNWIDFIVCK